MDSDIKDRYVSYNNIDCYKYASDVINCIMEVISDAKYDNPFWEAFKNKIPQACFNNEPDEKVLYLVCSSVFYIEELFENARHEKGIEMMQKCEYDCC